MDNNDFIKKYMSLNNNKIIKKDEKNISKFLISFILNKNSKILQIGHIDKDFEKLIRNKIIDKNNYHIMTDVNFNFNKYQKNNKIIFNTIIFAFYRKTYDFCIKFSAVFKQIDYLFFYYNDRTKLCDSVRTPFVKKNFHSLLCYYKNDEIKGAKYKNKKIKYEILKKGDLKGEIGKFNFSFGKSSINITAVINHLINKYNFNNYLEIGVCDGNNFNHINCLNKFGIDPEPSKECSGKNIYLMTSDEYFQYISKHNSNILFDIIFIDGSKLEEQVDLDLQNSLKYLSNNGMILIKNCNPPNKTHQRKQLLYNGIFLQWNGTLWKSYAKLRMNDPNLNMNVINCEWGLGIIQKGKQKCYPKINSLEYKNLDQDRANMLNLISIYDFLIKY